MWRWLQGRQHQPDAQARGISVLAPIPRLRVGLVSLAKQNNGENQAPDRSSVILLGVRHASCGVGACRLFRGGNLTLQAAPILADPSDDWKSNLSVGSHSPRAEKTFFTHARAEPHC